MVTFNSSKLFTNFKDIEKDVFNIPRKYTLTHSDKTGDLFLTISRNYDKKQLSNWYTKFMRDEVLGEWKSSNGNTELHLYFHISGGFIFGWAKMRDKIIRSHLELVFQAIRFAEKNLIQANLVLDSSPLIAHFNSNRKKFNLIEIYGQFKNYKT